MNKNYLVIGLLVGWFSIPGLSYTQNTYFYLDTGCEDCRPDQQKEQANYWLITDETYSADLSEVEKKTIWEDFRRHIQSEFGPNSPLLQQVTLRYLPTMDQIQVSYNKKIEKMQGKGYQILITDFSVSSK